MVVWQLRGAPEQREARALRSIGWAFLVLALYLLVASLRALVAGVEPHTSAVGITWVALTAAVMVALAVGKRRTGERLGNRVLIAESTVTLVDSGLAVAVLLGLLLDGLFGLAWADPAAALVVTYYAGREGLEAVSATVPRER